MGRGFDGREVLREEGRFAYAAAHGRRRTLAVVWLAWLGAAVLPLERLCADGGQDSARGSETGAVHRGANEVDRDCLASTAINAGLGQDQHHISNINIDSSSYMRGSKISSN